MARASENASLLSGMWSGGLYKRNQGRLTRQVTALCIMAVALWGAWSLSTTLLADYERPVRQGVPLALAAIGLWFAFRIVNFPKFADFLISVEAEMDKVSWPDRTYLIRATGVVLGVMILMAAFLAVFDVFWFGLFDFIGFLDLDALRGDGG